MIAILVQIACTHFTITIIMTKISFPILLILRVNDCFFLCSVRDQIRALKFVRYVEYDAVSVNV